jgi:hypothetical protein
MFHFTPYDHRHNWMRNGLEQFVVVVIIIIGSSSMMRSSCCSGWVGAPLFLGRLRSHTFPRQRCLLGESIWHPDTDQHDVADSTSIDNNSLRRQQEESGDGTNKHSWTDEEFEAWILFGTFL